MNNRHIPVTLLSPILFFAMLFLYTKIAGPLPLSISSVVTQKTDTFSVTGEGKVTVSPDIAIANLGVQTQGPTAKQTQNDLNRKINAVSDAIKKLGIDEKDIQTTNYSIYPNYDSIHDYIYNIMGRSQKITGYNAKATLLVKVRDMDKINEVIDTATAQGANIIGGISFDISDRSKAEDEARQKAFQEAFKKAQRAAQIAGFQLGRVINYSENTGNPPFYPMPMTARSAMGEKDVPTSIEPGSQEVTVTVTISYEIR